MVPVIVPGTVLPRLFTQLAAPLALGPVELNRSSGKPLAPRRTTSPGQPHCSQSPGAACAAAAMVNSPVVEATVAAASSPVVKNRFIGMPTLHSVSSAGQRPPHLTLAVEILWINRVFPYPFKARADLRQPWPPAPATRACRNAYFRKSPHTHAVPPGPCGQTTLHQ